MTKRSAFGAQLQIGDGDTPEENFTTVAHARNFGGIGHNADTIDVTGHDSPDAVEEIIATILRTGELTCELIGDPEHPTHDALTGLERTCLDRQLRTFRFIWNTPNNATREFQAFVTSFVWGAPYDGAPTANVTIKPSGVTAFSSDAES